LLVGAGISAQMFGPPAHAADRIVRVYQSPRAAAMGGTRITTGFFEDNFFGNPARTSANPIWRVFIVDGSTETNFATLGQLGGILAGGDVVGNVSSSAGSPLHLRGQTFMPAVYVPRVRGSKFSLGAAIFLSSQFDIHLRRSYLLDASIMTDVGPVLSGSYTFLKDDSLSVGMTLSGLYRFSAERTLTLAELLQGQSFGPQTAGAEGAQIEVGLGAQYRLPRFIPDWDLEVALTVQNLLSGSYQQLAVRPVTGNGPPRAQPRAFGVGVALRAPPLWKITDGVIALEFLELGNAGLGNFFRHIHLGTEWRYQFFLLRAGLNQGYFGAGFGFDLTTWTLDFAFYGEELGLSAGDLQDRRIAFRLGLQIRI
jgi:hypothetical protein